MIKVIPTKFFCSHLIRLSLILFLLFLLIATLITPDVNTQDIFPSSHFPELSRLLDFSYHPINYSLNYEWLLSSFYSLPQVGYPQYFSQPDFTTYPSLPIPTWSSGVYHSSFSKNVIS